MVLGWIILAVIMFALAMAIMKSQDLVFIFTLLKKNLFNIVLIVIVLFFAFSLYNIQSNNDLDLTSADGLADAGNIYLLWLKSVGQNLAGITGYVVEQDWWLNETSNGDK